MNCAVSSALYFISYVEPISRQHVSLNEAHNIIVVPELVALAVSAYGFLHVSPVLTGSFLQTRHPRLDEVEMRKFCGKTSAQQHRIIESTSRRLLYGVPYESCPI